MSGNQQETRWNEMHLRNPKASPPFSCVALIGRFIRLDPLDPSMDYTSASRRMESTLLHSCGIHTSTQPRRNHTLPPECFPGIAVTQASLLTLLPLALHAQTDIHNHNYNHRQKDRYETGLSFQIDRSRIFIFYCVNVDWLPQTPGSFNLAAAAVCATMSNPRSRKYNSAVLPALFSACRRRLCHVGCAK